jgi:hypothetical protein
MSKQDDLRDDLRDNLRDNLRDDLRDDIQGAVQDTANRNLQIRPFRAKFMIGQYVLEKYVKG